MTNTRLLPRLTGKGHHPLPTDQHRQNNGRRVPADFSVSVEGGTLVPAGILPAKGFKASKHPYYHAGLYYLQNQRRLAGGAA